MSKTASDEKQEPLNQVYQGKFMREGQPLHKVIMYDYAWPLLKSSMSQQIKFEQYGELPERLQIKHEEKILEERIHHYIKKNPTDRFAFMKGLVDVNKYNFAKFTAVRAALHMNEFIVPMVVGTVLDWIQNREEETFEATLRMLAFAMLIPLLKAIRHIAWEYFAFHMIEVGHRAHTSLKVMLFRKNMKMTGATNKDFSTGEINGIIMGESNRIWTFIWEGPAYFECAFDLICASIIVFNQIGWCGLIVLVFVGLNMFYQYLRGKVENKSDEKMRENDRKKNQYINESFNNIKTVKLFGWE